MAYIGKTPVIGNFVKLDSITVVNGQAAYTMQNGSVNFTSYDNVNQFLVSLNGVLQAPTDSFTVSGSTLTFASNLSTGDVIDFVLVLGNSLDIGTPSDNTVTAAKIASDAVVTAKINNDAVTSAKADFFNADTSAADLGAGLHIKTGDSGVTSPNTSSDELVIEGSGTAGLQILTGSGGNGVIDFGDSADNNIGRIIYNHTDNAMQFFANASEKMRIEDGGEVKFTNTPPIKSLDFGSCTVTLADNAFIDFPATSGFWVITETVQTGQSACMVAGGGSTAIAGQTGSAFNNADSGTFRFFKVTSPAAAFRFKNAQGNSCSFGICHISTRPST
jgi:hypothetical protein